MASHFSNDGAPQKNVGGGSYSRRDAERYYANRQSGSERHTGRTVAIVIGIIVALVLVAGATTGVMLYNSAMTVKAEASELMAQAASLKDSLKNGDSDGLASSVDTIVEKTALINAEVHTPLWDVAALIPVVGEDIKSVQTLGRVATELVNEALVPVSSSLSGMKLSDIIQDGSINVGLIQALSSSLDGAMPVIEASIDTIAELPEAHVPQIAEVLGSVQEPVREARGMIENIKPILDVLPQMLGANGQSRSYLVIAQNNAELRTTGGLPGSWGMVTITDGQISLGEFSSILHDPGLRVDVTAEEVNATSVDMGADPAQVNFTPDFVRIGEMAREYWIQKGYGTVDGVIAIDPIFLQRLLALTGGFTAPDGATVDGTNAAKVLLSDTYWKYGSDPDAQDAYFTAVAGLAFDQIMGNLGAAGMTELWDAVETSGEDGRLLVWMVNEDEQQIMVDLGLDGSLETDPTKPVLGVYINDDTYSKISWYTASKTVIGEGVKNADGTTTYDVTTTITNTITPEEAYSAPLYVYGNNEAKRDNSDMLDIVFFYAPAGGTISNLTASDGAVFSNYGIVECSLNGLQLFRTRTHLLAGETATFTYQVTVSAEAAEPLALRTTPLAQESLMQ